MFKKTLIINFCSFDQSQFFLREMKRSMLQWQIFEQVEKKLNGTKIDDLLPLVVLAKQSSFEYHGKAKTIAFCFFLA